MNSNSEPDEISLIGILRFLKSSWKTIAISGLAGLVLAIIYIVITPKKYEAVAQIAMAQIAFSNNNNNNNINPLGINIEEPSLLIARLSAPTSFPAQVLSACGIDEGVNSAAILAKSIKLVAPKGVANVVDLKSYGKSPEAALICAQSIFELIKTTQEQIVAPYIAEAKMKLDDDLVRLEKAKDFVSKADKSGSAMGAAYLSTRDEIRYLLDEMTALKNIITSNQSRATRLVAPIYASDSPVAPKKQVALAAGIFGGLFFGLLFALALQAWTRLKDNMQEQNQGVL